MEGEGEVVTTEVEGEPYKAEVNRKQVWEIRRILNNILGQILVYLLPLLWGCNITDQL